MQSANSKPVDIRTNSSNPKMYFIRILLVVSLTCCENYDALHDRAKGMKARNPRSQPAYNRHRTEHEKNDSTKFQTPGKFWLCHFSTSCSSESLPDDCHRPNGNDRTSIEEFSATTLRPSLACGNGHFSGHLCAVWQARTPAAGGSRLEPDVFLRPQRSG